MINFFKELKASIYYGKALKKIKQKRFDKAISFLEEAYKTEPNSERRGLLCFDLGRCHFSLNEIRKAVDHFNEAFDILFVCLKNSDINVDISLYRDFAEAYSILLEKNEIINDYSRDIEKFKKQLEIREAGAEKMR